jgi:branched-subunit amino acid aminotransferase/4-amino-4-deoxychorismate lyase
VLLEAHAERLRRGAAELGLPAPDLAEIRSAVRDAIAEAGLQAARAAIRVSYTAGSGGRGLDRPETLVPRLFAAAHAAAAIASPARLRTSTVRRNPSSPASRLKTLSYSDNVEARRQARAAGDDEALMLSLDGAVACAAAANVFWIEGDRLVTPALDGPILPGIMRAKVIAAAASMGVEVLEGRFEARRLAAATGVFLTNSLIGVRPVSHLDGQAVADTARVRDIARAIAAWA